MPPVKIPAALVVFGAGLRQAQTKQITLLDERALRTVNAWSDLLHPVGRVVMQAGSLGAVAAASGAALLTGRRSTAAAFAFSGGAMWVGAKQIKQLVGRGRPSDHLEGIVIRGKKQSGLGYPSGHAAVSAALALVASQAMPNRVLGFAAIAAMTGVMRIYTGAHFPSDVIGGAALGFAMGNMTNLVVLRCSPREN